MREYFHGDEPSGSDFISLAAIPFLLCGEQRMVVSMLGVLLFSMTMSITYGMALSVLNRMPGAVFGVTTLGLFLGLVPAFLAGRPPVFWEHILVALLVCAVLIVLFLRLTKPEDGAKGQKIVSEESKNLNMLLAVLGEYAAAPVLLFLEAAVVCAEALMYRRAFRDRTGTPFRVSVLANLKSFLLGLLLAVFITARII